jgi:hypothetical protein
MFPENRVQKIIEKIRHFKIKLTTAFTESYLRLLDTDIQSLKQPPLLVPPRWFPKSINRYHPLSGGI